MADKTNTPTDKPGSPATLSTEQVEALVRETEKHKAAQRQVAAALGVLWNAQLDMVIPTRNVALLERVLARPLNLWNDCDCCGTAIGL
jgi:hypothetical protein